MRRRPLLFGALILVAAAATVITVLAILVKQEPDFYAAALPDQPEDDLHASEVLTRLGDLQNDIRSKADWQASFGADELNATLRQNLEDGEWLAEVIPAGFHQPRVAIDGDRIFFAARYGEGSWSTIVSVELRTWLVKDQVNTVAVELIGIRAGALPMGTQSVLDWISERVRDWNIDVTWYRHDGHPVGLFRFYADQTHPTTQIQTVKVAEGKFSFAGRSRADTVAPIGPATVTPEMP